MKNTLTIFSFFFLFSSCIFAQNWTIIPYEDITDEGLRIISMYEDSEGNIWGGNAYSGRIIRWDGEDWEVFNNDVTGLVYESPSVGSIFQDSNEKIWFCSFGDGVTAWENGNWSNYNKTNSDIPSDYVLDVAEEEDKLWFTMSKRLVSFDGTTWTSIDIPETTENPGDLASMGTRVQNLFDYLEDDETITEFLDNFPTVKFEQVERVLQISQHLLINVTEVAHENFA